MTAETSTKTENRSMLLFSIFYIAVGIVLIGYFAMESSAAPIHIPILGIISLITAVSLLKLKKLALPLVVGFFFVGMTFGAATLLNSIALQTFGGAMLLNLALIVYMILLLITTIAIAAQRESLN